MDDQSYQTVSGIIFAIMAIFQLTRLIFQVPIHIDTLNVPMWPSAFAFIVAVLMCIWAFRSSAKK